jgi:hypothetical protein
MKDETKIPFGDYCYTVKEVVYDPKCRIKINICPYWCKVENKPEQMNGYCRFLERGDWESESFGLLFDQVKECGINTSDEEEPRISVSDIISDRKQLIKKEEIFKLKW